MDEIRKERLIIKMKFDKCEIKNMIVVEFRINFEKFK